MIVSRDSYMITLMKRGWVTVRLPTFLNIDEERWYNYHSSVHFSSPWSMLLL